MNWFTEKIMGLFGKAASTTESLETTAEVIDYGNMKVADLKAIAKERGVKGYYKLKKAELVETLTTNQGT